MSNTIVSLAFSHDEDSGIALVFCKECLIHRSILQLMSQNTVTANQTMDNSMSQTILN